MSQPVSAQSPDDRAVLAAWDDSLQRALSIQQLDSINPHVHGSNGKVAVLRRALFLIRRGDLRGNRADIELALTNTSVIRNHTRNWPWPAFTLARAFAVMIHKEWIETGSDGAGAGEVYIDGLWRTLREALDADADFLPARRLMIALTLPGGDRTLGNNQAVAFAREVQRGDPDPDALLIWARHLRANQQFADALAFFDQAQELGADRGVVALERARTLRALGRSGEAEQSYWFGAEHLTSAGREQYRFDLAWIISADSLAAFNRVSDDSVASWLHRFWNERDATAANELGSRLLAHLQRWIVADVRYRIADPWQHTMYHRVEFMFEGGTGARHRSCIGSDSPLYELLASIPPVHPGDIRYREPLLDHRGLIYLRHGEPLRRFGAGNQSWLYLIDGRLRLLHFRGSLALGMNAPTTLSGYLPVDDGGSADWFSRAILPVYAEAVKSILEGHDPAGNRITAQPEDCYGGVRAAIAQSRDDAHTGTRTDTDSPPILYPWRAVVQAFALGSSPDGDGMALVTFALASDSFATDTLADGRLSYAIHFRIVAYNAANGAIVVRDTMRMFVRDQPLKAGQSLAAWEEIPLGAGQWQIAVRARQADDSSGVYQVVKGTVVSGDGGITLSDIVTGIPGAPLWQATDGIDFPINYLDAWYAGQTAELFYEVHGIAAGDSYRTSIEVRSTDPKAPGLVQVESTDLSSGPMTAVRKTFGLERLAPGKYRVAVTVSAGGVRATRQRIVTIIPKPGA